MLRSRVTRSRLFGTSLDWLVRVRAMGQGRPCGIFSVGAMSILRIIFTVAVYHSPGSDTCLFFWSLQQQQQQQLEQYLVVVCVYHFVFWHQSIINTLVGE